MNKRKQIRNGVVSYLTASLPGISSILGARHRQVSDDELPAINVWCGSETAQRFDESPRRYKRELELNIDIYARSKALIDEVIEDLITQVEYYMDGGDLLGMESIISEIIYTSQSISADGRDHTQETGVGTIRYSVEYYTRAGAFTDDLPDFNTITGAINEGTLFEVTNVFTS